MRILRRALARLTCWLVGHHPQPDRVRSFSYRYGVCTRCHVVTKPAGATQPVA